MAVSVNVNAYVFAHGHRPRGYGSWAFFFDRSQRTEPFWVHSSKFTDAKKKAVEFAKKKRQVEVFVGT